MGISVQCEECGTVATLAEGEDDIAACPGCGADVPLPKTRDVFISYATPDLIPARQVAAGLAAAGVSHWLAPERIEVGQDFVKEIDAALQHAKVVVLILSSALVERPWVRMEMIYAKSNSIPILPLKIEDFEMPTDIRLILNNNQWENAFQAPFETVVDVVVTRAKDEVRKAIARAALPKTPVVSQASPKVSPAPLLGANPDLSPYVGPQPFPAAKADQFFGRDSDRTKLMRALTSSRLVLVHAPSGTGKSSMLNTVIRRDLEELGMDVCMGFRVGGALPSGIKAAEIRNIFTYSAVYGLLDRAKPSPRCRLDESLSQMRRKPGTRGRVLIFDQFEELFTQHSERFEDRADFIDDVVSAMQQDPTLRVVFAIRQEFLADVDDLAKRLPADILLQPFALRRLQPDGALEAITRPAAPFVAFSPGVAEEIVTQLNTIRAPGFDGVLVEKRGEYIEMVHLQIVCDRLWKSLPRGKTTIDRDDVERAAGEGKTFKEFVVNVMKDYFDDTIREVSSSSETARNGGYSENAIRLGCMMFITPAFTRTMVQQSNGRAGRLPDWIVEQLEKKHLLRVEQRGGMHWCELSHDSLAQPIGQQMNRDVTELLFSADVLSKVTDNVLRERGGTLQGYFKEHLEILGECRVLQSQYELFATEAEFIFRASLTAGVDMAAWSQRLSVEFESIHKTVLLEALTSSFGTIRANAAKLLSLTPIPELSPRLLTMAVDDPEESVRRTAAMSVASLNSPVLFEQLIAMLDEPASAARANAALALVRVAADQSEKRSNFETCYSDLDTSIRRNIRTRAWFVRLREGLAVFPYVVIPSAILSAITTGLFKWVPGIFGWALCQEGPSALGGLFHGITAALIWGGYIPLAITLHRVVFFRRRTKPSALRPVGSLLLGGATGFIAGFLVTLIIAGVFAPKPLLDMGWTDAASTRQFSKQFWYELLVLTKFGWAYSITGTSLGIAMAMVTNGIRADGRFDRLVSHEGRLANLRQLRQLVWKLTRIVLPKAWPLPLLLLLSGSAVLGIVTPGRSASDFKKGTKAIVKGLLADCGSQCVGGFFAVVGMGVGIVAMNHGVEVKPRKGEA